MQQHTCVMIAGGLATAAAAVGGLLAVFYGELEPWAAVVLFVAVTFLADIPLAWVANRSRPAVGPEAMIGDSAVVESGFDEARRPASGRVRWRNELWEARVDEPGSVHGGDEVEIVAVQGLRLQIRPRNSRTG